MQGDDDTWVKSFSASLPGSYRNRYTNGDVDPNAGDANTYFVAWCNDNTSASPGSGIEYLDPIAG